MFNTTSKNSHRSCNSQKNRKIQHPKEIPKAIVSAVFSGFMLPYIDVIYN